MGLGPTTAAPAQCGLLPGLDCISFGFTGFSAESHAAGTDTTCEPGGSSTEWKSLQEVEQQKEMGMQKQNKTKQNKDRDNLGNGLAPGGQGCGKEEPRGSRGWLSIHEGTCRANPKFHRCWFWKPASPPQ